MKAPDKIIMPEATSQLRFTMTESVEYIRKEALLEWANEQIGVAKANNLAYSPFEKLINKLNEM